MERQSLYFLAPGKVEVRQESLPTPGEGMVLVKTLCSAISSGTEMLFYRGQVPENLEIDKNIAGMDCQAAYPLKYGYSLVGEVTDLGPQVDPGWLGKLVFAFHPHESCFTAAAAELIPIPQGISSEDAVFLPNMETAVNFLMDGAPIIGEQAAVFGQGVVGLLTASLLARFPLAGLVTLDRYPLRRAASERLGVTACLDPSGENVISLARSLLKFSSNEDGADLTYELSGAPEVLDQAIALTGFNGRIVIGSWYGVKRAPIDLGGRFHRSRIRLIGSQVSTIAPLFSARWSKARRFACAWELIRQVHPAQWITQRVPIPKASEAYQLLAERPGDAIQVILTY